MQETATYLYISQLQSLNTFYTNLIKKKQMDINFQQNQQTISIREQNGANSRLRSIQSDCVDLYYYWLNELLCMEIPYDKCAFALHQLMTGNCHWFLAKYGHMRLRASINYSNSKIHYDQAIISYQISIDLIENNLPKYNKFYLFIVHRFMKLILDATNATEMFKLDN
ncbi:hypothetical protein QQG55_0275 [Brugia pahangi]